MSNHYSAVQPLDHSGNRLKPLDLVIIQEVPKHYWLDPEFSSLRLYRGCYGLITYAEQEAGEYLPYYMGNPLHPGWASGDGSAVHVLARRTDGDVIWSWDAWLPPNTLQRIPYNCILMNIFSEYPWQMREDDGPGSTLFVRKGIPEFDYLNKIMCAPYSTLLLAHEAAMNVLEQNVRPA